MASVILLFPPQILRPYLAKNSYVQAPTIDASVSKTLKVSSPSTTSHPATLKSTENDLKGFLLETSVKYGLDYDKMNAVINCESTWRIDPPHNGVSLGIAQFTAATWVDYGVGKYEDIDPYSQIAVMGKMWSKGLESRWDCYKILYSNKKLTNAK